ncbi:MAG: MerR family transcriptional regulator [Ferruginibacter sp.]
MALKQSAFDFDFPQEDNNPAAGEHTSKLKPPPRQEMAIAEPDPEPILLEDEVVFKPAAETVAVKAKTPTTGDTLKKSTRGRMKLSDMNASAELIEVPEDKVLFEKRYYSIGAVSDMFKVNQSLIRFWENEFNILKPKKNAKGDRFFRPEDVKNLKLIYHLLRERKYTIEGAKEFLKKSKNADKKFEMIESLKDLRSFLFELKANL